MLKAHAASSCTAIIAEAEAKFQPEAATKVGGFYVVSW